MKDKILKLKKIIADFPELAEYGDKVQDDWTMIQFNKFVSEILIDFNESKDKENRPIFYTSLQLLLNKYDKDNPYPQKY